MPRTDEDVPAEEHDVAAFEVGPLGPGDLLQRKGRAGRDHGTAGSAAHHVGHQVPQSEALLETVRQTQGGLDHGVTDDDHGIAHEDLQGDRGELDEQVLFRLGQLRRPVGEDPPGGQESCQAVELVRAAGVSVRIGLGPASTGRVPSQLTESPGQKGERRLGPRRIGGESEVERTPHHHLGQPVPFAMHPDAAFHRSADRTRGRPTAGDARPRHTRRAHPRYQHHQRGPRRPPPHRAPRRRGRPARLGPRPLPGGRPAARTPCHDHALVIPAQQPAQLPDPAGIDLTTAHPVLTGPLGPTRGAL